MEAIRRNQTVAIVFSTAGLCKYQIFTDQDGNRLVDDEDALLGETILPRGLLLENITFPDSATSFTSRGRPGGDFGGVDIKDSNSGRTIRLTTTLAGYVHLADK
jgi:hypothetical protein